MDVSLLRSEPYINCVPGNPLGAKQEHDSHLTQTTSGPNEKRLRSLKIITGPFSP